MRKTLNPYDQHRGTQNENRLVPGYGLCWLPDVLFRLLGGYGVDGNPDSCEVDVKNTIVIELFEEQKDAIQPLMEKVREMVSRGLFTMVIAQLFEDHMECGVLSPAQAEGLHRIMGGTGQLAVKATEYRRSK